MTLSDLVQKSDLNYRELFELIEMCYRDLFKRNPKLFEDPNLKYFATIDDIRKFAIDNYGEINFRTHMYPEDALIFDWKCSVDQHNITHLDIRDRYPLKEIQKDEMIIDIPKKMFYRNPQLF